MSVPTAEHSLEAPKVLLVDDNTANLQVLRENLEGLGYKLLIAKNGRTALDIVRKAHPDLVLLDIMMPEMDGYDLATEIRRLERTAGSRTPILAITASDFDLDEGKARSVGLDGYMLKPLDPKVLAKKLADIFCGSTNAEKP